ncbi:ABC transporter permease [Thermovenabulum gondwanense]|uniref:Glutathione transport system permease protein GsiD n=1 Tax=Thermovenabulum gondwanense TaxID=520767 RepID=A0A161PY56_9FIRM|nr:ABC transporter permease [Thermovenabulum gondwanense]KYO66944.1 Glutathione transport system permease protein GsiD [Thermovenabulum gondwanense]
MNKKKNFIQLFISNQLAITGFIGVAIIVLLGLFAPFIAEQPKGYGSEILLAPSMKHLFGTDNLGLDVFAEVIWGARTSLFVSSVAVIVAIVIGVPAGLISGYKKGIVGSIIDGLIDIFLTLPVLPLMIVIAAVVGSSVVNVAIVIGLFSWPSLARVARNATLKISEMQFIEAAKCLGIPSFSIIFRHILLNIMGPILVNITLIMATAVLSESGLSFLGLGDPTTWSWGTILKKAWDTGAVIDTPNPWWWWFWPSIFIMFYVVSFNLLGTGINDILNPKTRD